MFLELIHFDGSHKKFTQKSLFPRKKRDFLVKT